MKTLYLDYAATTPVAPEVMTAMNECMGLDGVFANPASRSHRPGWEAEHRVELARQDVAACLKADPREIVWTSGATESNNLALKGAVEARGSARCHLITCATEHKAVLDVMAWLQTQGHELTVLKPDSSGLVHPSRIEAALRDNTLLVSLMWVNNETGVIQPIDEVARLTRSRGVLLHVDAAQAFGKLEIDLAETPVDLLSVSGHKIYGPKGVGALFVRRQPAVDIVQQIHGGGHERGMRSGTLPTHQLAGLAAAARICCDQLAAEKQALSEKREAFLAGLSEVDGWQINGDPACSVPGIINLAFERIEAETVMSALPELAVSSGSACNSESVAPSHVLLGMGLPPARALSSVRFSLGRYLTLEEAAEAGLKVARVLKTLRG